MALAIAIFAYPVVRGLTKRIERLQEGVETLGAGNLATRVAIGGRDEVARLADELQPRGGADRGARRRTPAAARQRLARVAHAAVAPSPRHRALRQGRRMPEAKAELERDIAELDDLIEEILLASRLDIVAAPPMMESLDLLALVAEECAHYDDCTLEGAADHALAAMPSCCGGWSAISSRTPRATASRRSASNCDATATTRFFASSTRAAGIPADGARAGVRAVLPARRRSQGNRARALAGAPDRTAARRRGEGRRRGRMLPAVSS